MTDNAGRRLTAFTVLKRDQTYRTSLVYDDGGRVEQWGSYEILFPNGPASISDITVTYDEPAAVEVTASVGETRITNQVFINLAAEAGTLFAGPLPEVGSVCQDCASGTIRYDVEGWTPQDVSFSSPQSFEFEEVGEGYVRVYGPGADGNLGRRYARR
jgi:hypothetical protein